MEIAQKRERFLVSKVEFFLRFPSEIKTLPIDPVFSIWVHVINKAPNIIVQKIRRASKHLFFFFEIWKFFFKKVSGFLMFTCVHYSFPIFDWLCLKIVGLVFVTIAKVSVFYSATRLFYSKELLLKEIELALSLNLNKFIALSHLAWRKCGPFCILYESRQDLVFLQYFSFKIELSDFRWYAQVFFGFLCIKIFVVL